MRRRSAHVYRAMHRAGRTANCQGLQRGVAVNHASSGKGSFPVVRGAGQDAGSADPGYRAVRGLVTGT